jgi:DNA excision repair protein ERCC-2
MEIRISVRNLVEFILRSGNIDNRRTAAPENAMQEGGRIHRMIQRKMGSDYHAEVFLRYIYKTPDYEIQVEGRADGIIIQAGGSPDQIPELSEDGIAPAYRDLVTVTIDEIKGTYRDIHKMKGAVPVHLAQARCYAYIYGVQNCLKSVRVRLTYCNIETEEIRYFHFEYDFEELEDWFFGIMEQYRKWSDFQFEWQNLRGTSIKSLAFPFPYRQGQKELASYVYQTIYHKKKLFIEAPTGAGKTLTTIFPSVKAVGEGMGQKIFYLTAKTITRTVADSAIELLREQGLKFKSVTLTAKDKICFMEETECNPEYCPYAKGHFDRINDAIFDLLTSRDNFSREAVESFARAHQVCPFEMCLDMSLFADAVIGDYNYLFDPHVYLKRFFSEGIKEDYLFLIDEAHNLVDRGREMYSAVLKKEDFLALKKVIKDYDPGMYYRLEKCNRELLSLKRECEDYACLDETQAMPFIRALLRLSSAMETYLEEQEESPVRKDVLDFYFEISHFLLINDRLDSNYVTYTQLDSDGGFCIRLFCVNPSKNLGECMMRGRSAILFSATLLPIQYYKRLLGAKEGDYEVYACSVFDARKKGLFIANDVTSKYTRRSELEYYKIASYIHRVISQREGNYMVFFPSHTFLQNVYDSYRSHFQDPARTECLLQEDHMEEDEREAFLSRFALNDGSVGREAGTLVGFCVLGGIFSEGIDLKNDSLIGAVIVGTGLPQVCNEREILKKYFDSQGDNGFDFAYRYPGMNKVLQAAGRVIRTVEDVGIVVLLDERFLTGSYLRMFPREWVEYERVSIEQIGKRVERFWDEWL